MNTATHTAAVRTHAVRATAALASMLTSACLLVAVVGSFGAQADSALLSARQAPLQPVHAVAIGHGQAAATAGAVTL